MTDLSSFHRVIARVLVALAFVHVPLLAGIAWALGRDDEHDVQEAGPAKAGRFGH